MHDLLVVDDGLGRLVGRTVEAAAQLEEGVVGVSVGPLVDVRGMDGDPVLAVRVVRVDQRRGVLDPGLLDSGDPRWVRTRDGLAT